MSVEAMGLGALMVRFLRRSEGKSLVEETVTLLRSASFVSIQPVLVEADANGWEKTHFCCSCRSIRS